MKQSFLVLLFALGVAGITNAYVLEGQRWNSSPVSIQMNLSATSYRLRSPPSFPLFDGATSWDGVYSATAAIWNPYMANMKIATYSSNNSNGGQTGDEVNEAFFGSSLGGSSLDSNTLGLTVYNYDPNTNFMIEADTAFNPSFAWNSYRGPLLGNGIIDFRRVAIHELGHILGLDHPDTHGQMVNAIMNSVISKTDTVTADDIAGVQALYGAPATTPPVPGQPVAKDFNGDGFADLVWEYTPSGDYYIWLMRDSAHTSNIYLGRIPLPWRLAGVGDFNGDGEADVVWENTISGECAIWLLRDSVVTGRISLGTVNPQWQIVAAADFNGDGQADLVWENTITGERAIWFLKNGVRIGTLSLGTVALQWHIAGAADFNGDSQADLVWENTITGERAIWFLKNGVPTGTLSLGTVAPQWHIAGAADFNGDGQADLVWENMVTGECAIWLLKNGTPMGSISLGSVSTAWQIMEH